VRSGEFRAEHLSAIRLAPSTFDEHPNWDAFVLEIEQRLQAGKDPTPQQVDYLLHSLALLMADGCTTAYDVRARLANNGHLMHWLQLAQDRDIIGCKTWCIISFLLGRPEGSVPDAAGRSTQGYQTFKALLRQDDPALAEHIVEVCNAHRFEVLFPTAEHLGFDQLVVHCLKIAADSDAPERFFTPANIRRHWRKLRGHLDENSRPDRFSKLILKLSAGLVQEVISEPFRREDCGLYRAIIATSMPVEVGFEAWCRARLQSLDTESWTDEVRSHGDGLRLALELGRSEPATLKTPFLDALIALAKEAGSGERTISQELIQSREEVLNLLQPSSRAVLPKLPSRGNSTRWKLRRLLLRILRR
jgi:hypothetical protein